MPLIIGAALAATLTLSACSSSSVKASLHEFVSSLGAQPNVQMTFSATASGPGTAKFSSIAKNLSTEISMSNPTGGALSDSSGAANVQIAFLDSGSPVAQLRDVDSNLYFNIDVNKLAAIPGVNISQSEAAEIQLVIGGRWFELPKSLLNSLLPKTKSSSASKSQAAADQAIGTKVLDAITKIIDTSHYTTLPGGGYSETGTLKSIRTALQSALPEITQQSLDAKANQSTYALTITTSGTTATGGSISVTAPNGNSGDITATLKATVAHANEPVTAPTGATTITPDLLHELGVSLP